MEKNKKNKEIKENKIDTTEVETEVAETKVEAEVAETEVEEAKVETEVAETEVRNVPTKKKFNVRDAIRYVVMVIALAVFGYSAYEITDIYIGYQDGIDAYEDIESQFFKPVVSTGEDEEPQTDASGFVIENAGSGAAFAFDFQGLLKMNKYAVGWIRLDDGEYISYPIIQCEDNNKYLRHLITGEYNTAGTLFVDYRCEGGLDARNAIIYGHNMRNETMFGSLKNYINNKNYYKDHPYFDIWVGETHYKYYVFSIYHTVLGTTRTYQTSFESDEAFMEYVELCKASALISVDVGEITAEDHIATLSTCVRGHEDQRLVMHLVRREVVED